MAEELKGKDGEVQISVDGDTDPSLNADHINQIMDKVNVSIEKTINTVNENLSNVLNNVNINNLKENISKIGLSKVIPNLTDFNLLSKLSSLNLKEKMPVIKAEDGKISVLLNEKKLLELDLPDSAKKE
ncbi:hypothetical protein J6TS2_03550 [Heyndrickxia sporothermodurans]|nr:hypothetical protein J6TS2_03550 [Heyndrickxia sporothermodurans]